MLLKTSSCVGVANAESAFMENGKWKMANVKTSARSAVLPRSLRPFSIFHFPFSMSLLTRFLPLFANHLRDGLEDRQSVAANTEVAVFLGHLTDIGNEAPPP